MGVKRKRKATQAKAAKHKFLKGRINRINRILGRLEGEFEGAIKRVITKGEQSSKELVRSFDDIVEWLKNGQIYALANGTKENLEMEIARLKKESIDRLKDLENLTKKSVFSEVKADLAALLDRIQTAPILETVKSRAEKSRLQLLNVLNIPDQKQLDHVTSRISKLEKKLQTLSKKAA